MYATILSISYWRLCFFCFEISLLIRQNRPCSGFWNTFAPQKVLPDEYYFQVFLYLYRYFSNILLPSCYCRENKTTVFWIAFLKLRTNSALFFSKILLRRLSYLKYLLKTVYNTHSTSHILAHFFHRRKNLHRGVRSIKTSAHKHTVRTESTDLI